MEYLIALEFSGHDAWLSELVEIVEDFDGLQVVVGLLGLHLAVVRLSASARLRVH